MFKFVRNAFLGVLLGSAIILFSAFFEEFVISYIGSVGLFLLKIFGFFCIVWAIACILSFAWGIKGYDAKGHSR